jgi:transcription elongation factor Elf1
MKIQITQDKFVPLLNEHWKWFEKYISRKYKKITKKDLIIKSFGLNDINDIEKIIKADFLESIKLIKKYKNLSKADLDTLSKCFNYEKFKENEEWNAYKYIQKLGVRICPYCNRNNIDYSEIEREKMIPRAHFDHFFPKDKYPYLSCSLYNLVPCCYTCNLAKSNKDTNRKGIIYPYKEEFGENGKFLLTDNGKEFNEKAKDIKKEIVKDFIMKLKSEGNLKKKIDNSEIFFHLCELYSQEQNFIRDLLEKIDMYSETLDRMKLLGTMEGIFFRLFFNLPESNDKIYPYQKITMDIIEQSRPDLKKYFPKLANI